MKEIPLTQGKITIVDDADYEWLNQWKWYAQKNYRTWYAERVKCYKNKRYFISMHRLILNTPEGMETDHVNCNGLDNRRENLRICNHAQNQHNQSVQIVPKTSYFKGVHWVNQRQSWRARIKLNKKTIDIMESKSEIKAALAYDKVAMELFSEFANINFKEV